MISTSPTNFFGSRAEQWSALYRYKTTFKDRLDLFTLALQAVLPASSKVLDFGCGPGTLALALEDMGYDVLGVDGAQQMIEVARAEAERRKSKRVRFAVMNAEDLSLEAESYDAVICSSVLEYIDDDMRFVADIARVIRTGGYFLVSVPHTASVFGMGEDIMKRSAAYTRAARRQHLTFSRRRYQKKQFLGILEREGFGSFCCTYFESPIPGKLGVGLSRFPAIGVMLLVVGRKLASGEASQLVR